MDFVFACLSTPSRPANIRRSRPASEDGRLRTLLVVDEDVDDEDADADAELSVALLELVEIAADIVVAEDESAVSAIVADESLASVC